MFTLLRRIFSNPELALALKTDQPDFVGPLLILSAGRSGSTYVQRILNTCKNAFIFGEHGGALGSLARSVASMEINSGLQIEGADAIISKRSGKQFTAWATPFQEMDIHRSIGASLEQLYTAKIPLQDYCTLWGIKEIRYDGSDLQKLIRFFPNARVIILVRNFQKFARSTHRTFWAAREVTHDDLEVLLSDYIFLYASLLCACESYGIRHEVLHYESVTHDWKCIIDTANRLVAPFVLDADLAAAHEAALANVDYVEPDNPHSDDRLQFDRVLKDVLDAGGARRLSECEAMFGAQRCNAMPTSPSSDHAGSPADMQSVLKNANLLHAPVADQAGLLSWLRKSFGRWSQAD